MKTFYLLVATTLMLVTITPQLNAQTFGSLGPLFDLLNQDEEDYFNTEFDGLTDSLFFDRYDGLRLSDFNFGLAQDSLFYYINDGGIDQTDSLSQVWTMHQNDLNGYLLTDTLNMADSLALQTELDQVNSIWYNEYDSLNVAIDSYQDSLSDLNYNIAEDGFDRYNVSLGKVHQAFNNLEGNHLEPLLENNNNLGLENIDTTLSTSLFNSALDIELAFGQEYSDVRFYNEIYNVRSSLIRMASVPKFDQNYEFRWAIEGSFFNNDEDTYDDESQNLASGLNPFICNGEAAIMYTPMLGCFNGIFRLYTSIGIEMSTYVPSHLIPDDSMYGNRVGNTTGYGPQIGVGFSVSYDDVAVYGYGTVAHGDVIDGFDYRYNSMAINAGVRFGNAVNVRYSYGDYSWAPERNKSARYSRFTVGIILDELNP